MTACKPWCDGKRTHYYRCCAVLTCDCGENGGNCECEPDE